MALTKVTQGMTSLGYPGRNKSINGNFNINQRGYVSGVSTTVANQYTLDRWRVPVSGQNLVVTTSGNGNAVTAPAGGVEQVIEGLNIEGGTFVLNWVGTASAFVNGLARAKGEPFTLPAGVNAAVKFVGGTVSLVQLEAGRVVTPFEYKFIGAELAMCQRYTLALTTGAPNSVEVIAHGYGVVTTGHRFAVITPVPLRVEPTLLFISGVIGSLITDIPGTPSGGFTVANFQPRQFNFIRAVSGGTANAAGHLRVNGVSNVIFIADAEIY